MNIDKFGLGFQSEDSIFKARIAATPELSEDRKLLLPDKSGTIATTDDITDGGGASPLVAVVLDTEVDITENTNWNNVFSVFEAERNSKYFVTGFLPAVGAEGVDVDVRLHLPDGEFIGCYTYVEGGGIARVKWNGDRVTGTGYGSGTMTFAFEGILITTGDEVDFRVQVAQTIEDPTTTVIPTGGFITFTKAQ